MPSPKNSSQKLSLSRPVTYQIKVQGHLDKYWSDWFDGLTNDLLDLLKAVPAPQVLCIAGGAWGAKQLDFDNLQGEKSYGKFKAIGKTAALNYLLTLGQISRYPEMTFYNYGPALVRTATVTENQPIKRLIFNTGGRFFSRSPEQAADDIVTLLTSDYSAGCYGVAVKAQEPEAANSDAALSEKLWDYSDNLVDSLLGEQQERH